MAVAILGILAGVAMPLAQVTAIRTRELELRRSLRNIREGVDQFKAEYDKARTNVRDARDVFKKKVSVDRTGYPLTLDEMVETKILRRVPHDPMTADGKWVRPVLLRQSRVQPVGWQGCLRHPKREQGGRPGWDDI